MPRAARPSRPSFTAHDATACFGFELETIGKVAERFIILLSSLVSLSGRRVAE
jgi:hypothetical protein